MVGCADKDGEDIEVDYILNRTAEGPGQGKQCIVSGVSRWRGKLTCNGDIDTHKCG